MSSKTMKELNEEHIARQESCYQSFLTNIGPETNEMNKHLEKVNTAYHLSIAIPSSIYEEEAAPFLNSAAELVNPEVKRMQMLLSDEKKKHTKKVNAILGKFAKFKNKVESQFAKETAAYKSKFESETKEEREKYEADCALIQANFEELVKDQRAKYIDEAAKIEEEFVKQNEAFVLAKGGTRGLDDPEVKEIVDACRKQQHKKNI